MCASVELLGRQTINFNEFLSASRSNGRPKYNKIIIIYMYNFFCLGSRTQTFYAIFHGHKSEKNCPKKNGKAEFIAYAHDDDNNLGSN